MTYMKFELE